MGGSNDGASSAVAAPSFATALISGGVAGTTVDVALFPIDTLKTRLQSPAGFIKAGGFRGIYNGLGAAALGSAPGAALFFCTYEEMKPICRDWLGGHDDDDSKQSRAAISHMLAASAGEAMACLVRVPTEVVKAKMQTAAHDHPQHLKPGLTQTVRAVWQERHGGSWTSALTGGLYRGYFITLFREIPFAMIQFPLYEWFKVEWRRQHADGHLSAWQAATCGSVSGAIAAAFTTPLDVIKTRLMLGADEHGKVYQGVLDVVRRTYHGSGTTAFFSGLQPRVLWITLGGFVFFGAYEESKTLLTPILH